MLPRAVRTRLKCLGSSQDGSNMASRAPKTAPRRPQDPPRRLLYASWNAPGPPKTPSGPPPARPRRPQGSPRASKTAQGASKTPPGEVLETQSRLQSSPEEALETPSRLQELSRGAVQASNCCPAPSSLWPASGLGKIRATLTNTIPLPLGAGAEHCRIESFCSRSLKMISCTPPDGCQDAYKIPPIALRTPPRPFMMPPRAFKMFHRPFKSNKATLP